MFKKTEVNDEINGFFSLNWGFLFLCYKSVFEINLVLPHQYKKLLNWDFQLKLASSCIILLLRARFLLLVRDV